MLLRTGLSRELAWLPTWAKPKRAGAAWDHDPRLGGLARQLQRPSAVSTSVARRWHPKTHDASVAGPASAGIFRCCYAVVLVPDCHERVPSGGPHAEYALAVLLPKLLFRRRSGLFARPPASKGRQPGAVLCSPPPPALAVARGAGPLRPPRAGTQGYARRRGALLRRDPPIRCLTSCTRTSILGRTFRTSWAPAPWHTRADARSGGKGLLA